MRITDCAKGYTKGLLLPWNICLFIGAALILCGCSANSYRKSADKQTYGIIQDFQREVFGKTNEFTIDTPYSHRKPTDISASELIENSLQHGEQLLTIEHALDLAASTSRRYQSAKEALFESALTLTGQRHQFRPNLFATVSGSHNRNANGEITRGINSRVGVSQLFKTGGELGLDLGNSVLAYYSGGGSGRSRTVLSEISGSISQPILRGFGKNNPRVEQLVQAERNVVYAVRNFSYFQDSFSLEIVNDYYGLLAQKDVIRNRYTNYLGRVQSTQRLVARSKDRERSSDVDQARQAELTAKNNYVNSVANYRNALDQFKIKLGLPVSEKIMLEDTALQELEQTGLIPARMDSLTAYRLALEHQLLTLNAIDRFEDSKRKVRVAADQLRPDLRIFASASVGSEPEDYTKFDPDRISRSVGFALDLPIDRLNERNFYRATLISFEEQLRTFTLALDTLQDNIQRGLRTLDQRRQNYEIQTNALALANRRVASATLMLEAGRAEVRDLVEAQDAQISAENAVTVALVDYHITRLQLMLDIGALESDKPKFWVHDHLAGYLPDSARQPLEPQATDQAVLPPDNYFNN